MKPNYTVAAEVVDINRYAPTDKDTFYVDTNVLYFMTYTRYGLGKRNPFNQEVAPCLKFIGNAISARSILVSSYFALLELANAIERKEKEIFSYSKKQEIKTKVFRHNYPAERQHVVAEVNAAWGLLKTYIDQKRITMLYDVVLNEPCVNRMIVDFSRLKADGPDMCQIQIMEDKKIKNIISNDGDFSSVPGLKVFTANQLLLATAKRQNKLVKG